MRNLKTFLLASVVLATACLGYADVRLPKTFTDNAVLQRNLPIHVWGWADAGENVTVTFGDVSASAVADAAGNWSVKLPALPASCDGKKLVVKGKNEVVFENVVVGEVWVCSGQSNMEQPLNSWGQARLSCTEGEISNNYSFIRFNRPYHRLSKVARDDVETDGWQVCNHGVQKNCTACGFHFAVRLHKELGCPIGLIDSNWGGSNINSWIPDTGWANVPETTEPGANLIAARDAAEGECTYQHAGGMFNAMLSAWTKYTIRGAIWYQGCSNAGEGEFYYFKQKAMILEWRKLWGLGDFPFYWVQLANFRAPNADPNQGLDWAKIRDGQTRCMEVVNSGQAVVIDIGEEADIHPRNKFDVGNRLARWALANVYHKDKVIFRSPMFESAKFDGGKALVKFSDVGDGLVVAKNVERVGLEPISDGTPAHFAIAGEDQKFYWAEAKIVAPDTVELSCPEVPAPVAVRFAWQMNPDKFNLYSKSGLPVTPFRTDAW